MGGLLAGCSVDSVSLWCRVGWGHLQPITRKGEGHELGGRGWQEGDSAEEVFEGEHDGGHYERKNY